MSRRPPTRSPATTSDATDRLAERPAPERAHVVDRALAVHRLLADGRSSADVQRRLRVSKSTVSVLGYLGAALAGMEPASVAELRTPAVTARAVWALATAARVAEKAARRDGTATADADARDAVRRQAVVRLRATLRDHLVQARLTKGDSPGRGRTAGRRAADRSAAARALGWSHGAWADDPVVFARTHLAALAAAHAYVSGRAARAVALAGVEQALASQVAAAGEASLRSLSGTRWRALAAVARVAHSSADTRALAALAVVSRKLSEAENELAHLESAARRPTTVCAGLDQVSLGTRAESPVNEPITSLDVEADLDA